MDDPSTNADMCWRRSSRVCSVATEFERFRSRLMEISLDISASPQIHTWEIAITKQRNVALTTGSKVAVLSSSAVGFSATSPSALGGSSVFGFSSSLMATA